MLLVIHSYSKRTRSTPTLATFASTFLGKEHEDLYPEKTYRIVIIEMECTCMFRVQQQVRGVNHSQLQRND